MVRHAPASNLVDRISHDTPDEIAEAKHKDTHASELDSASQVGVESFD
jgi:hypothetical protein